MSEPGNWDGDTPRQAAAQVDQSIPWAAQAFRHISIAFYGAVLLGILSFGFFVLVVVGCIGRGLSPHAQIVALTVLGLMPAIVALALLRHTQPKAAGKEPPDMGLLIALAKEIAKLFGKT